MQQCDNKVCELPYVIFIGAGVLGWTASKMIVNEPSIKPYFADNTLLKWGFEAVVVLGILIYGKIKREIQRKKYFKN